MYISLASYPNRFVPICASSFQDVVGYRTIPTSSEIDNIITAQLASKLHIATPLGKMQSYFNFLARFTYLSTPND